MPEFTTSDVVIALSLPKMVNNITANSIENRPILSGNFTNQPATELYNLNSKRLVFVNAQKVEDLGFFIGLHTKKISNKIAEYIAKNLLKININIECFYEY